jgi:hypothetical protein
MADAILDTPAGAGFACSVSSPACIGSRGVVMSDALFSRLGVMTDQLWLLTSVAPSMNASPQPLSATSTTSSLKLDDLSATTAILDALWLPCSASSSSSRLGILEVPLARQTGGSSRFCGGGATGGPCEHHPRRSRHHDRVRLRLGLNMARCRRGCG